MEDRVDVKGAAQRASAPRNRSVLGVLAVAVGVAVGISLVRRSVPVAPDPPPPLQGRESAAPSGPAPAPPAPAVAKEAPLAAPATPAEVDPYGMPPPSPDQIKPRPEQRPPTAEEQRQTQQAATRLIESSILRIEFEGRRAEQSGDPETARRSRIRVERLRKRLDLLKQESAPAP